MTYRANERVAWFNGEILPESQVLIPFRDRGFKFGDAVFDLARTFAGRPFKLAEHVERLYKSLAYCRIDPGMSADEMTAITEEVLERNEHLRGPDDDYWIGQRITRGIDAVAGEAPERAGPNVVVECTPIPFRARARHFRDGIEVIVPSVRRVPPGCLSPRAKTHNYLNLIMGDLEVHARDAGAWAVLLDVNGNLCEGLGSNIFTVSGGALSTPREDFVLPGVSRQTVIDLAREAGIEVHETDIALYDAYTADEAFITSTSLCLCPVKSVNGVTLGDGRVPGPVTQRLIAAYSTLVDHDFVGQYLRCLDA
ncbi:MAG: aminotransferase class IV [Alphaproteobacteria bacterium]